MARLSPNLQDALPNPSKVLRPDALSNPLLGIWNSATDRQAWTRLEVNLDQRVKITSGNTLMSGLLEAHQSGELKLTLYSGAGESTARLEGTWQIHGEELTMFFKATELMFARANKNPTLGAI